MFYIPTRLLRRFLDVLRDGVQRLDSRRPRSSLGLGHTAGRLLFGGRMGRSPPEGTARTAPREHRHSCCRGSNFFAESVCRGRCAWAAALQTLPRSEGQLVDITGKTHVTISLFHQGWAFLFVRQADCTMACSLLSPLRRCSKHGLEGFFQNSEYCLVTWKSLVHCDQRFHFCSLRLVITSESLTSRQFRATVWWAAAPGPMRCVCCGSAPEVRDGVARASKT